MKLAKIKIVIERTFNFQNHLKYVSHHYIRHQKEQFKENLYRKNDPLSSVSGYLSQNIHFKYNYFIYKKF